MKNFTKKLSETGIIPVICPECAKEADTLMRAIENTPIGAVEITLRHPYAPEAIARIRQACPSVVVGAGTVVNDDLLKAAISAGAAFCVSPGFDERLVLRAADAGMLFLPGCATPSEIQKAVYMGLDTVKFFPAECSGGTKALKLYAGAFKGVKFVPTGGITMDNLGDYLSCSNVAACGGSFMAPRDMFENGDHQGIHELIMRCTEIKRTVAK